MKRLIAIGAVLILALGLLASCSKAKKYKQYLDNVETAEETVGPADAYYADIVIENYGTIVLALDRKAAPITVDNFVKLAESGFYEGTTFHRIIKGFMMQGGAGDAQSIKGEFTENGWNNPIKHERGVISMARANDPDSGSSQFFIMHETSPHLDGKYAAFGRVISGMEIVDKICNDAKPVDNNGTIPKAAQPVITSITIRPV